MQVVFTDLDGSLLDHDTYSFDAARQAMGWLTRCGIPLIFVSSKTRSELMFWRRETGNIHPFVIENGGAIVIPKGYFNRAHPGERPSQVHDVIELGTPYEHLVPALKRASHAAKCRTRGFNDMSREHIATQFSMSLQQAGMAKQREFDEPFLVMDEDRRAALLKEIELGGYRCSAGGRLLHLSGSSDKGVAVRELIRRYEAAWGPVRSLALGDGMNDLPMLASVTVPVILNSPMAGEMSRRLPQANVTDVAGPEGWNQAVLSLVARESMAS